jgi:CrcB protein
LKPQSDIGATAILLKLLYIAVGGAVGALARFGVGEGLMLLLGKAFPYGTLVVNVAGCFLLGMLAALHTHALSAEVRTGLAAGFLGALTTFSTFGFETIDQLERGQWLVALANVMANLVLGFLAVWLGLLLARSIAA